MTSGTAPKVLICAPNVSARFGGEAILPLRYFELLRKRGVDVRLIAHSRNRADLEKRCSQDLDRMMFVPDSIWHRLVWKAGKPFPRAIRDSIFGSAMTLIDQRFQTKFIRKCIKDGQANIIHQPIPVSPLAPSWIYGFDVPVVMGPMNGGMNFPDGYEEFESLATGKLVVAARFLAQVINRVIQGKKQASTLLVANERTRRALPFPDHPHIIQLVENGVDVNLWQPVQKSKRSAGDVFRLVYLGRMVDWKALDFTLAAVDIARRRAVPVVLDLVGDGAERGRLEAMTDDLGLRDHVRFLGFRSHEECSQILKEADALILNSVWECGGAVVLEAMSAGLPVIGPDWGGPADYINEECGVLVHPEPKATYASRICDAIADLAANPSKCTEMGLRGRSRVIEEFDWEKKIDRILDVYASSL